MKYKNFFIASIAMTIIYAVLIWVGTVDVENRFSGIIYKFIVIAVLLFSCYHAFSGLFKSGGAMFLAGALGLALLTVYEIFSLSYIYLWGGNINDISVIAYTRNCAYLLFLTGILFPLPVSALFRKIFSIVSTVAAVFVLISVVIADRQLLQISSAVLMLLCLGFAVMLLYHSMKCPELKSNKLFAVSIIIFCLHEVAYILLINLFSLQVLYGIMLSFYPAIYFFIGIALAALRNDNIQQTIPK